MKESHNLQVLLLALHLINCQLGMVLGICMCEEKQFNTLVFLSF